MEEKWKEELCKNKLSGNSCFMQVQIPAVTELKCYAVAISEFFAHIICRMESLVMIRKKNHTNLRKILDTSRVSPDVPGTPGRPGGFQQFYVIFSFVLFLLSVGVLLGVPFHGLLESYFHRVRVSDLLK